MQICIERIESVYVMPGELKFDHDCLIVLRSSLLALAPKEGCALLVGDQHQSKDFPETSTQINSESPSPNETPMTSATTKDVPAFGWSAYAERVNGRFAMIGFVAVLLIEAFSREAFLQWAGLVP